MDSKKLCAFNLTRESFLSMGLTAVDSATDPLAVLKVLVEGLELDSESGFWITSLTGIPGVPRISPFDLVYLTEGKTVVRGIEVLPGVMLPALEKQIVSVLVLPLHTVSSTQTRAGDRLLLCAEEEMMRHLAQISHKSGDTAIAQNGGVVESPPRRTVIPPPIVQVPAQRAVSADESRRESVARAEREIRAKVDSLRAAPVPLAKATESEAERSRTLKATPPAIPKIEPNQTPNGAGGSRKVPPRNQTPQIPVPAAGSSGTHNIEFTVAQAPMWRISSPVLSTSTADIRKLPVKESRPAPTANGVPSSKKAEAGAGEIAKPIGTAAKGGAPTRTERPTAVPTAFAPTSAAPSISASAAKTETAWVEEPKRPIATAPLPKTSGIDRESSIEKQLNREAAASTSSTPSVGSKAQPLDHETEAQEHGDDMSTGLTPHWLRFDRMKSSVQRFRQWLSAEPPATDRRRSDRKHVPGLVAFYWTGGAPTEHRIADISETGFYLLTEDRWIKETMLQMTLQRSPGKDGRPRQSLAVLTKVVRRGRDGVGHEFVMSESLDRSSREVLPARGTDKLALGRFL